MFGFCSQMIKNNQDGLPNYFLVCLLAKEFPNQDGLSQQKSMKSTMEFSYSLAFQLALNLMEEVSSLASKIKKEKKRQFKFCAC